MKFLQAIIFLLFFSQSIFGQVTVQGRVINAKGEGLPRINVLVYLPGSKVLIAFAVSDEKGHFQTIVKSPSDSLNIEVSSVQFRNEFRSIANISQDLQFQLIPETKQLEGITVKAAPIEKRGDTISYLVSSFAKKEDRAIEDVLRRMPGIEVEPSGRILYQGMPLEKFYVEGLDLMDGRYGVISKNLPQGAVSTVEVLENHQPLRILDDRVSSQQASLNLKMKRDITTTGTAKLGTGLAPFLWDVNITPMTFTKNFQVLTSYQANNTGNDAAQQLAVLTVQDFLKNMERPNENPGILSIQEVSKPEIDQKRYLDNNINLFNINALQRINNDFQLRTNLSYINDFDNQQASQLRTLYTPTDTLAFIENYDNQTNKNYVLGEFTLSRNVKKNYLNNELKIQSQWDGQMGLVYTGETNIEQSLKKPFKAISNELRSVNPFGKHLVEFNSYISYDNSPHNLTIKPGQFEVALNQGEPYEMVNQNVNLSRFYTDNSASFVMGSKRLVFTPKFGLAYRQQLLESKIFTHNQEMETKAGAGFENMLDGRHFCVYAQTDVEYKKSDLTVNIKLRVSLQKVILDELNSEKGQELTRFLFDPSLSVNYQLSSFWKLRGSWSYTSRLGDIDGVHYGYILTNYRNLSQNAAPLSETNRQNFSAHISYRNPITSFFNSLSYIFSIGHTNLTYSNIVQSDGTSILQAVEIPQTTNMHSVQAYSSKYFSALRSTISLHANYNQHRGKSLMNAALFDTKNEFYNIKPDLNVRITNWLNSDYSLDASYIKTYIENEKKSSISMLRHNLNFFAFPAKNQLVSLSSEYYNHLGNDNFFFDLLYRYTFTKQKIDLEMRWNNIFDNKTYTTLQASAFTVYESTYMLRPSQILLLVKFGF